MYEFRYLTQTLTLAALGALVFSGCGEKVTGSIPEPGDSSSSAASEGATAETTGSHSGECKGPEGEYRAADEQRAPPRKCPSLFSRRG